jgi:hypothetical protein
VISRRGFLQFLGAGAAVTAAGLMVPDVARKIFLPPRGGWAPSPGGAIQVGDVITFEGVHGPLVVRRCKQFIITSTGPLMAVRYDACWTRPDGEEVQSYTSNYGMFDELTDSSARELLESAMRYQGGTPGATHFKLELPRNIIDARYV